MGFWMSCVVPFHIRILRDVATTMTYKAALGLWFVFPEPTDKTITIMSKTATSPTGHHALLNLM